MKSGLQGMGAGMGGSSRPDSNPLKPDAKGKARLTRTEFVILFIWKEPTPYELILPEEVAGLAGRSNSPEGWITDYDEFLRAFWAASRERTN